MKLRHAKQLLKQYKPILEVLLPYNVKYEEISDIRKGLDKMCDGKFLVIAMRQPEPLKLNADIEVDVDEFIKKFRETGMMWAPIKDETLGIIQISNPINLYTVLDIEGTKLYKKKLADVNKLMSKYAGTAQHI